MLNLAYLFDPRPGPLPASELHLYLALMALFAAGLGASTYWCFFRRSAARMRPLILLQIPLCLLVLGLMAARLLTIPFLSTTALLYGVSFVSVSGWAAVLLRLGHRGGFLERQLTLLTFSWEHDRAPVSLSAATFLLGGHVLGLILLATHFGRSYCWMVGLFLVLLSPQLLYSLAVRKQAVHLEALSPLWFAYLAVAARRLGAELLARPLPSCDGFQYPDLAASLLNGEAILVACAIYALACQGYLLSLKVGRVRRYMGYVGASLLAAVFIWAGAEYFRHRTHGVTANDPYAYAQMAVDIAHHGDPLHRFSLFPRISTLGISWWPVVHYGYQVRVPPLRGDGSTASDWPAGWPAILSLAYLLVGERGLYVANPIMGLLCLSAVAALVAEVLYDRPWSERLLGGGFAAFVLATSYEQVDRLLVPMADASVQLFTVLTVFFILRGMRRGNWVHAALGGFCFGWAYFVRHTQLVLGLCALLAVLVVGRERLTWKERWTFLGVFGLAAFLVAIPDLLYHHFVFGHFLRPESTELDLFSLTSVRATAGLMWGRLLSANEFGYLSPLIVYGAYRMAVERRGQFLTVLTAVLAILAIHLPYAALRLRDLLSLFPLVTACAAYAVVDVAKRISLRQDPFSYRRKIATLGILLALLLLPTWRTWAILPRPTRSHSASFGYVSAEERRAFDLLANNTLQGSVVGSSLNGGPIDLYAGRDAFRPAFWRMDELDLFLQEMFRDGRTVYILDDGEALKPCLDHVKAHYESVPVTRLSVPLFGDPEQISGLLYRIGPPTEVRG